MGTRSKTTVFDEFGAPLLSFYRQMDGYFEGHGAELQEFLKGFALVNGYGSNTPTKAANGMGCLAAQIIAHFKNGIGNIYICNHDDTQEFNYDIKFVKGQDSALGRTVGRVSLVGKGYDETKRFALYEKEREPILRTVQFVYDKRDGEQAKWRMVDVTDQTSKYLCGYERDTGKFKRFLVSRILDGRILPA